MYASESRHTMYRTIGEHHWELAKSDLLQCVQLQNCKLAVFMIVKKYYDLQTNRVYIYLLYRSDEEFIKGVVECKSSEEILTSMQPGDISFILKNEIAIHCHCIL